MKLRFVIVFFHCTKSGGFVQRDRAEIRIRDCPLAHISLALHWSPQNKRRTQRQSQITDIIIGQIRAILSNKSYGPVMFWRYVTPKLLCSRPRLDSLAPSYVDSFVFTGRGFGLAWFCGKGRWLMFVWGFTGWISSSLVSLSSSAFLLATASRTLRSTFELIGHLYDRLRRLCGSRLFIRLCRSTRGDKKYRSVANKTVF